MQRELLLCHYIWLKDIVGTVDHENNSTFMVNLLEYWSLLFNLQEEFGHLVLLALFDCVDDTVLVKKIMFSVRLKLFSFSSKVMYVTDFLV